MKILIAEDDLLCRQFLYNILSNYGECTLAEDGLEALNEFLTALKNKTPFQLIFLDIMMPKVNGVKTLKGIREMETQNGIIPEKRARVIITTALAETNLVKKAYEYGCDAYLPKPFNADNISEIINLLGILHI